MSANIHAALPASAEFFPHETPAPLVMGIGAFVVLLVALIIVTRLNKDR
jgi:hypothetical protein